MLGLLGGLLGRAIGGGMARRAVVRPRGLLGNRPGGLLANRQGGLLGGLINNRSRGGSGGGATASQSRSPEQREEQQQPPTQETQATPAAPPPEPQVGQQTAQPQPFVQKADQPIQQQAQKQEVAAQQPTEPGKPADVQGQEKVTAGLLDDPPAVPQAKPTSTTEPTPVPQAVVNQTDSPSPVARPENEEFGTTPILAASGISDRLSEAPPRRDFPMEDPNPSQPVQQSQAKHTGNSPGYHYQTAGSFTAYSPSYSYRRR